MGKLIENVDFERVDWKDERRQLNLNIRVVQLHVGKDIMWMRVFGRGFCVTRMPMLFSERYGYKWYVRVGFGWRLQLLRKEK